MLNELLFDRRRQLEVLGESQQERKQDTCIEECEEVETTNLENRDQYSVENQECPTDEIKLKKDDCLLAKDRTIVGQKAKRYIQQRI